MEGEQGLLWEESRFSYLLLVIVLLFFSAYFFYLAYDLMPLIPAGLESVNLSGLYLSPFLSGIVSLFFLAIAVSFFFAKPIKLTQSGIIAGNKYFFSSKRPGPFALSGNIFKFPFKRSLFIPWSQVMRARVTQIVFTGYDRLMGSYKLPQDYLKIDTIEGQTIWIGISQASIKFSKVKIQEVLKENAKS